MVCHQLGYGRASRAPLRAEFGQGTGEIWLDDVQCTGLEDALDQCENNGWGDHNCRHSEDAGAVCEGEWRITGCLDQYRSLCSSLHSPSLTPHSLPPHSLSLPSLHSLTPSPSLLSPSPSHSLLSLPPSLLPPSLLPPSLLPPSLLSPR